MREWILFGKLDNISVGRKLLMMYVLCVLIPILSINLVLYSSNAKWVSRQEMSRVKFYMDRAGASVAKTIEDCVGVAITLSSDITLNDMLEKEYTDSIDYLTNYRIYLGNALSRFNPLYSQIQSITLYTNNGTIIDGGNYVHLDDSIIKEEWYDKVLKAGRSILVYPSIDSDGRIKFSLLKILNSFKFKDHYLKILKIDLKTDFLENVAADDPMQGDLYFINERNDIILSTKREYLVREDRSFARLEQVEDDHKAVVSRVEFSNINYLSGWKLVGIFPKETVFMEMRRSRNSIVILALISLVSASAIVYFLSRSLNTRLKALIHHMKKARKQDFEVIEGGIGNDEVGELIVEFNRMATKIKELIHDVYHAEIYSKNLELERRQAVLNALESQINPHFMYNTLNTIRVKSVLKNETETADIIKCVAKTFRRVITWGNDMITIREEVEFIQEYLKIQKYRFEDKVDYRIQVQPDCMEYKIPKMSIQTLMENACIHGVENVKESGMIALDIFLEDQYLCCIVQDNGEGIDEEQLRNMLDGLKQDSDSSRNIGIRNVYKRFSTYFGNNFYFHMENREGGGLKVTVKIACGEVQS